jgi:hypothetical protein
LDILGDQPLMLFEKLHIAKISKKRTIQPRASLNDWAKTFREFTKRRRGYSRAQFELRVNGSMYFKQL